MLKRYFFSIFLLTITILLSGCARYVAHPLRPIQPFYQQKQTPYVSLAYKVFSRKDCKEYLGRDVIKKGFQPIQITITNNSDHTLSLLPSAMSPAPTPVAIVARKTHFSTATNSTEYLLAGPLVWACAWIMPGILFNMGHQSLYAYLFWGLGVPLMPLSLIPGIVEGVNSFNANKKLDKDYNEKELRHQIIAPHATINGVVFIPLNTFKPNLSVVLTDEESRCAYTLDTNNPCVTLPNR